MNATRYCLYRQYGENDLLLYIGISNDGVGRQRRHLKSARWRAEVRRITIEPIIDCQTFEDAARAERRVIRRERPKYNVIHNRPRLPPLMRSLLFVSRRKQLPTKRN